MHWLSRHETRHFARSPALKASVGAGVPQSGTVKEDPKGFLERVTSCSKACQDKPHRSLRRPLELLCVHRIKARLVMQELHIDPTLHIGYET